MLTEQQKNEIIDLIRIAEGQLGNLTAVANKCGVSNATITLILQNKYETKKDDMWLSIGRTLGWRPDGWNIAETSTNRSIYRLLQSAQQQSMFIRVSEKAGAGKSTGVNWYMSKQKTNVYRVICRSWGAKEFLEHIVKNIGASAGNGYKSTDDLLQVIIDHFKRKSGKPLLIIDQANSLKPACLNNLIHLFNELEDHISVALFGTENLKKDFERGVKYAKKGYDELDSRFARTYVSLNFYTFADVTSIAHANGIANKDVVAEIWDELKPINHTIENKTIDVVLDGRRIKRLIQKYLLLTSLQSAA